MKLSKSSKPTFEWETGIKGWVLSSKENLKTASGVYFEVTGHHGKVKTPASDRVYFVISGTGEFVIGDEVIAVKEHDMVIVPRDTVYDYRATDDSLLKLFLVHVPAYDPDAEIRYEQ